MNWRRVASALLSCCVLLSLLRAIVSQSCSAVGSLHFVTFDGKAVDFPYACKYVMAKTCSRLAPVAFEIRIKTVADGPQRSGLVRVQYVEVAAEGKTVRLWQDGRVHVDGSLVSAYDYKCRLKANRVPLGTELSILTANVSVTLSERGLVLLRIPESLKTLVCGLCGNFDGNGDNDYSTQTAAQWFLTDPTDSSCVSGPVASPTSAFYSSQVADNAAQCYTMIAAFATCNQTHPSLLNDFKYFCLQDMLEAGCTDLEGSACTETSEACNCGLTDQWDVTCRLGEALATQFALLGCNSLEWKSKASSECRKNCTNGSRYSVNASSCSRACGAKDVNGCRASVSCSKELFTDGCVCPEGQLWSGSSCVTESNCACTFGAGLLYPMGSKWLDSTCSAEIECLPMSQLNYTMMQCADNSECVLQNDQWQCRCREGYTGDGRRSCNIVCGPGEKKTCNDDSCERCPIGSYQPGNTTSTSCIECPGGKLTNAPGSVSISDCVAMDIIPADARSYVACQNFDCVKQVFVPVDVLADGIPVGADRYRTLWVSSNAVLSFGASFLGRQTRNMLEEFTAKLISPFWLRMDFRARGSSITIAEYSQRTDYDNRLQIVKKMLEPLAQYSTPTSNSFVPLWAVIVTWTAAMPFPHQSSGTSENVTVQLVLASDGWTTKTAFIYPVGRLHLTNQKVLRDVEMGFNLKNGLAFRFFGSGTPLMGQLDRIESNTGIAGRWIFDLAQQTRKLAEQKACIDWYSQQAGKWTVRKPSSISCPCDWRTALEDPNYRTNQATKCAISLLRSSAYGFYQMCCYDSAGTGSARLLTDARSAGRPIEYNPNRESEVTKYSIYDEKPFLDCCIRTENCHLYRQYRPADNCAAYRPPTTGGGGGDPHFKTLDGLDYTYNAIGEFYLLRSSRMSMQTRLGRFGSSDATAFKAIACQSLQPVSSRIHIELNSLGNGLLIMVKSPGFGAEANETTRFVSDLPTEHYYNNVTLIGTTKKLRIIFENGYGVNIGVTDGMIQQSIFVPQSENQTVSGLLGNYDGNPLNDLALPNGVSQDCVTSANKNRCINDVFGPAWRISGNESILWYRDLLSTSAYTDYTFKPLLLDSSDLPSSIIEECGTNEQCQYDYLATNSSTIARSTKTFVQVLSATRQTLGAIRPVIQAVSAINATVGSPLSFGIDISSSLSKNVTVSSLKAPPSATLTKHNDTTYIFYWLPDEKTDPVHLPLRFIAKDGSNTYSAPLTVKIAFCQCNLIGGTCEWPETFGEFALVPCNCYDGWTGTRCSENYNACDDDPCGDGGSCTDMLPGTSEEYECKCNSGYYLAEEPPTCLDIDECANTTVACGVNEVCINTLGNYTCDCLPGFSRKAPTARCEDIDECISVLHNQCTQVCNNYVGGYNCSCFAGFELNGAFQCVKAPVSTPNCDQLKCSQECIIRSTGQPQCACRRGFKLTDNGSCADIDECQDLPCGSNSTCVNTLGSFNCNCDVGFKHYDSSIQCEKCPAGTYGSDCTLTCSCGARARYCDHVRGCTGCIAGWTGAQCDEDVNECLNTIACSGLGITCNNTKGSYICDCEPGYQLSENDQECVDIDECVAMNDPCPHGFKCQNVPGSHNCIECLDGFEKRSNSCFDIDECLLNDTCSSNAECENTLGSYECRCTRGFYGDGRVGGCVDVDECSATPGPCPPESTCSNTPGSFTCICKEGRVALSDCCILLNATDECRNKPEYQSSTACCLLGGSISCLRSGDPLPAGAQCQPSRNTSTTPTLSSAVTSTLASSNVTSSTGDASVSSSATPSVGVFTIYMNHLLQVELPDSDESLALLHFQKAVKEICDRVIGFPTVQNFAATLVKQQNAVNFVTKRSIIDKLVYNVSYSATFFGGRERANEIVFSVAAAIIEADFSVNSYANTTVYFVSPLFFAVDNTPMIEATCQSLKACPDYCEQFSQLLPKCFCPNGVNSYYCLAATSKPETPEEESDNLPLWITAGVLGGILALALVTVLIVVIVRKHRREVNLHRQDPSRGPERYDRTTFGEYFGGIFRPVRRPSIHRRNRSESTSTASSNSTESYHSSPEGRVGLTVPFGPRWPKAYKGSTRPAMLSPANDNDDDQ